MLLIYNLKQSAKKMRLLSLKAAYWIETCSLDFRPYLNEEPETQNYTHDNPRTNAPSNANGCSRVEQTHSNSVEVVNDFTGDT